MKVTAVGIGYVLLAIISAAIVESLKIAAFNVQIFGKSKAGKPEVMATLVKIISRYDLVLIQEIRDSSGEAIQTLLQQTNAMNVARPFKMSLSDRLGRTSSKEQYAFFYRPESGLSVVSAYHYDDGDETKSTETVPIDTFQREPYVVLFESTDTVMKQFAIAGIHVDPGEAVKEITALGDVFNDIKARLKVDNVLIMGDLNADCSYVPKSSWKDIPLKHDTAYSWLINDEEDTTVSGTDCAYDRFVVTGPGFESSEDGGLVQESAKVFKFDSEYGLEQTEAIAVSDHYPIELELKVITSGSVGFMASIAFSLVLGVFACLLQRL